MSDERGAQPTSTFGWWVVLFLSSAGFVACLTLLFRSMRSVMEIGGSCASGGPYVTANPCPQGVGWLFPLSIMGGIALVLLAAVAAMNVGVPSLAWTAWPALFLSLGWNFWEYGLDPPGEGGIVWSWIVCGAMFVAMGGGPLLLWFANPEDRPDASRTRRVAARATQVGTRVRAATTPPPFRPSARPEPAAGEADDLVTALERLAALHASGAITDAEYRAAKGALIDGAGR